MEGETAGPHVVGITDSRGSPQPVVVRICFGFRTRRVCVCVCRSVHSLKREVNVHIWTEDHPVLSVTEMD